MTPQELAEAVTKMEARREAELQRRAETVTIGEALHALGLSASEEELLSEVETLRRQRAQAAQQAKVARTWRKLSFSLFALTALLIITILGAVNLRLRRRLSEATQSFTSLPMKPLSEIPDGVVVHVASGSPAELATGLTSQNDISTDTRVNTSETHASMFNNEWTLVKSGGALFVRAWTTADMALRAANGESTVVFSNRPAWLPSENLVPVQLPIYRFYDLNISGYMAKGEANATAATSVLEAAELKSADDSVSALVQHYLDTKNANFRNRNWDSDRSVWIVDDLAVSTGGHHVRLTGNNHDPAMKPLAARLTAEALRRLHIDTQATNDIEVKEVTQ